MQEWLDDARMNQDLPDADDVATDAEIIHGKLFFSQLTAIMKGCFVDEISAIKAAAKIVGDWNYSDDSLEDPTILYEVGTHDFTFEYKSYGITFERDSKVWLFEDYTKDMWLRDEDLLSGLLTCDKMREQGL